MGAAEQQQFSQYPLRYGDGTLGAAIAQTRDGRDELITPVALWELDNATGLYLPPGLSSNPRRPRVEATLSGSAVVLAFETNVEILPSETYRMSPIKLPYNKTRLILRDSSPAGNLVKNVSVRVGFRDPNLSDIFVFASLIEEAIPGDGLRYTAYEFESFGAGCTIDITNRGETTGTIQSLLVLGVDA